jgi:hypothetical protein
MIIFYLSLFIILCEKIIFNYAIFIYSLLRLILYTMGLKNIKKHIGKNYSH